MNKINKITSFLDTYAPLSFQESYDNSGLITGDTEQELKGVLITLDCTEQVIDEAISKDCNLIVAHHPIIFSGLKKLTGKNYVERTVIKAIKDNIAIYAAHTNLDNIHTGVNKKISDMLGLRNVRILQPKSGLLKKLVTFCPENKAEEVRVALFNVGAGAIGKYDRCSFNTAGTGTFRGNEDSNPYVGEPGKEHNESEIKIEIIFPSHLQSQVLHNLKESHPYEEVAYDIYTLDNEYQQVGSGMIGELETEMEINKFLRLVKEKMKCGCIKYTDPVSPVIKNVALCGGSGSFLLHEAVKQGADVFISSDFKYHQFFDADKKIVIADIGHFESEQFTGELLYGILIKKFPTFALHLAETKTNPVNYI